MSDSLRPCSVCGEVDSCYHDFQKMWSLAAGVWSDAELVELGAKQFELEVMRVALEMEAEGRIVIGEGGIIRRRDNGGN